MDTALNDLEILTTQSQRPSLTGDAPVVNHADDAAQDFDRPTDPVIIADLKARPTPVVFDFRRNWDQVLPHLQAPSVQSALDTEMNERNEYLWGPGFTWKREEGPWMMSPHFDFWLTRMQQWAEESKWEFDWEPPAGLEWPESWEADPGLWEKLEEMQEQPFIDALDEAWRKHGAPKPNTPDWYRCIGGCHMMAPFAAALGCLVYPELRWSVVRGAKHSTAWGRPVNGQDAGIFFDILNYEDKDGEAIKAFVLEELPSDAEDVE